MTDPQGAAATNADRPWVAFAIPAYNEDGIGGFLADLDAECRRRSGAYRFVVVDDASDPPLAAHLDDGTADFGAALILKRNPQNGGHGPTLVAAYREALATGAPIVVHLDGDGQCEPHAIWTLIDAIDAGADAAIGYRLNRVDPWFRKVLTIALRAYVRVAFGVSSRDANSPFKAFRAEALSSFLGQLPPRPLVPSVYLTVIAHRSGLNVVETPYRHTDRRGTGGAGTMWRQKRPSIWIPRRLASFVGRAFVESLTFRRRLG
jgi:glycosyltransferase involved in cell wall biosynthesis